MYRVRRAFWSGNPILQVSDGDEWRDVELTPTLETGFHVVTAKYLATLQARIELWERRAATARRSRARKKASPSPEPIARVPQATWALLGDPVEPNTPPKKAFPSPEAAKRCKAPLVAITPWKIDL